MLTYAPSSIRTAAAEAAAVKAEQASLAQARFLQTMSHEMRCVSLHYSQPFS